MEAAQRSRLFVLLAIAALALTFVVVVASATMRHAKSVGCTDWPSCYGLVTVEAAGAVPSTTIRIARTLHRIAASGTLVAIVALLLVGRGSDALRRPRTLAALALAIALALAALGIVTPGSTLPAVPLANLLGGFLMLAVLAALLGSIAEEQPAVDAASPARLRAGALLLLAGLFVQTFFGGLIGTHFALPACPSLDGCSAGGSVAAALNPFQPPVIVDGRVVAPLGANALHLLHRGVGGAIAVAVLGLAWFVRRRTPLAAVALAGLTVLSALTGAVAILELPAFTTTVLHNAVAASTVIVVAWMSGRLYAT